MNLRLLLGAAAVALLPVAAGAQDLPPCEDCADAMTVVSWGGAYQRAAEGLPQALRGADRHQVQLGRGRTRRRAKLRAQVEAGNVTWDIVDVEGPDSQRLCDEGWRR